MKKLLFIALICCMPTLFHAASGPEQAIKRAPGLLKGTATATIRIQNDTGKTIYYTYNGLSKPVSMANIGPTNPLENGADRSEIQNLAFSMSPISPENPGTPIDLTSIGQHLPVLVSIAPRGYLKGAAGYSYYPTIDSEKGWANLTRAVAGK